MSANVAVEQKLSVPFVDLSRRYKQHRAEILELVDKTLASGGYILGAAVESFENKMAAYLGCKHVVAVADGTDALILALRAWGIGAGDEVIVPVNSFIASAGAVAAVGATSVFCDIAEDLNLAVDQLEALITDKTKAIMPVHLTGRPVQMTKIWQLAEQYNLKVIEDAAQSIGATLAGKYTGTLGDAGCFSLHPLKNLHVYGDGGMVTTNNSELAAEIKLLRNHGLEDRDTCRKWGLNSRLDSVQARIAEFGIKHLNEWSLKHRQIAAKYRDGLQDLVIVPVEFEGCFAVYHNFVIQTDRRDELQNYLANNGIETKIHYPVLLHLQPAAASLGYKQGDFPVAERIVTQMMSLPIYPEMTDNEIGLVIEAIKNFFEEN